MSTYAFVDGSSLLSLIESARSYFSMDEGAIFDFGRFFQWEADAAARTFFTTPILTKSQVLTKLPIRSCWRRAKSYLTGSIAILAFT